MQGKRCVITGANSGIGLAAATDLAGQGAQVVMVCRNRERGEAARRDIVRRTGNEQVELLLADMSSLTSVRQLAAAIHERGDQIDVLINNAGGLFSSRETSVDGFEMTLAVNYLGPFLLTHLLLDKIKAAKAGRIVNTASIMQAKQLDLADAPDPKRYSSFGAYRTAKLALIMATYQWAKQLEGSGAVVNALHPGGVYTPQATRGVPSLLLPLAKLFLKSPEQGADLIVYLASNQEAGAINGKYLSGKRRITATAPVSYDADLQTQLYEQTLRWVGLA